ncbi:hypothetical protein PIB30_061118 [Stylosanthes scabra]|uniref:Uncharacterized protein n=1 Tax=Stylosanthes scabra TaxID=79078 RepID=A0ABU6YI93_9FABA|nr:hypothetical protein [Stylosanthes scabra]
MNSENEQVRGVLALISGMPPASCHGSSSNRDVVQVSETGQQHVVTVVNQHGNIEGVLKHNTIIGGEEEDCGDMEEVNPSNRVSDEIEEVLSDETLYRLNEDCVELARFRELAIQMEDNDGNSENHLVDVVEDGTDDHNRDWERHSVFSSEEDNSIEVAEVKDSWHRGGLTFESSDEDESLARLVERKIEGKKRSNLRPKKQKQGRKPPCI